MTDKQQITMTIRLGDGIEGEQRREDYETAAIKAGYLRPGGDQAFYSRWAREVLDREAKRIERKHK